ncbi:hypothetical protein ACOMHN_063016 [Nucella lapillus]
MQRRTAEIEKDLCALWAAPVFQHCSTVPPPAFLTASQPPVSPVDGLQHPSCRPLSLPLLSSPPASHLCHLWMDCSTLPAGPSPSPCFPHRQPATCVTCGWTAAPFLPAPLPPPAFLTASQPPVSPVDGLQHPSCRPLSLPLLSSPPASHLCHLWMDCSTLSAGLSPSPCFPHRQPATCVTCGWTAAPFLPAPLPPPVPSACLLY